MQTNFTVTDTESLNTAIQSIDNGGADAAPSTAYVIDIEAPTGTLTLDGPLAMTSAPASNFSSTSLRVCARRRVTSSR